MTPLRWAGALLLLAGSVAAPLNLLHAEFYGGNEVARVPLQRSGPSTTVQSYAPLIVSLRPEQSPVAILLEAEYVYQQGSGPVENRYLTHLILGSSIAAQSSMTLAASGQNSEPRLTTMTLLRTKVAAPGLYSILLSEAAVPAIALQRATLVVRANMRRADIINVLAGFALMMMGAVTLFATGRSRRPR